MRSNPKLECDIWDAPDHTVNSIAGAPTIAGLPNVSGFVIDGDTLVKVKNSNSTKITIPDFIKHIGLKAMAFLDIQYVVFPAGLQSIGSGAFACSRLVSATIPDSVTEVGTALFLECPGLDMVTLGRGITKLTKNMFAFSDIQHGICIMGDINSIDDSWIDSANVKRVFFNNKDGKNELLSKWLEDHHIPGYGVVDGKLATGIATEND